MVELRTLIVDDEPLARHRLRRMLRQHPGIDIVGECPVGKSAQPAQASEITRPEEEKFLVRSGQLTSIVSPQEIDWIEADGNYAILHAGGRNHLLRSTMSALETSLPVTFLRAIRFSILNLRRVKEIQSVGGNHFAIMSDDTKAPL